MSEHNLANQVYRAAVLVDIHQNGDFVGNKVTVDHFPAPGNGAEQKEVWTQTESLYDASTGFHAMAFERTDENGRRHNMLVFPGSQGSEEDKTASGNLVAGAFMDARYDDVEKFVQRVAQRIGRDNPGEITIATHSMGSLAIGAGYYMRQALGSSVQTRTFLLEPFGAGEALEQTATRIATQNIRNGLKNKDNPDSQFLPSQEKVNAAVDKAQITPEHVAAIGNEISQNVVSVRAADTIYSNLDIGDKESGNALIGRAYNYMTDDGGGFLDNFTRHMPSTMAKSMQQHGEHALLETQGLSGSEVLNAGVLSDFDRFIAGVKTAIYNWVMDVGRKFNLSNVLFDQQSPPETAPALAPENTPDPTEMIAALAP